MKIDYPGGYRASNLFRRLKHFPGQRVTYVQNPKVACTALELSLWSAYDPENVPDNPHSLWLEGKPMPYAMEPKDFDLSLTDELLNSRFFTVVRNPYSRFLSGYLNKILRAGTWPKFSRKFGFAENADYPTIEEFAEALFSQDPFTVDHHFRPQAILLMSDFIPIDFLGHLENMDPVKSFLAKRDIVLSERGRHHATGAQKQTDTAISAALADKLAEYYAMDFDVYGYSRDINRKKPVARTAKVSADRKKLEKFLEKMREKRKAA